MRKRIWLNVLKLVLFVGAIFVVGYVVFTWVQMRGGA